MFLLLCLPCVSSPVSPSPLPFPFPFPPPSSIFPLLHFPFCLFPMSVPFCLFSYDSSPLSLSLLLFSDVSPSVSSLKLSLSISPLSLPSSLSVPFCLFPSVYLMSVLLRLSPCLFFSSCSHLSVPLWLFPSASFTLPLSLCLFSSVSDYER